MFNALNRFISRLDGESPGQRDNGRGTHGFQVLRNGNLQLAIEPWFDFVVGINGRMIVCRPRCTVPRKDALLTELGQSGPETVRPRGAQLRWCHCHAGIMERKGGQREKKRTLGGP